MAQVMVGSGLLVWRFRVSGPTLLLVVGVHLVSATVIVAVLYVSAWFMNAV
jgi:hypothetical protein